MGQQLALTGDLGRAYPSEDLKISSFTKIKAGNRTKVGKNKKAKARKDNSLGRHKKKLNVTIIQYKGYLFSI